MDKDELWREALGLLLEDVGSDDPKHVFLNLLTPLASFGRQFILQTPSPQVESWVRRYYLDEVTEKLGQAAGEPLVVDIVTAPDSDEGAVKEQNASADQTASGAGPGREGAGMPDWMNTYVSPDDIARPQHDTAAAAATGSRAGGSAGRVRNAEEGLFEKCTFDTFVVGPSNEFARNAAMAVAEEPGVAYNPLFIYGSSGLGKTHLLVAIANYVQQNYPSLSSRYVSANLFLSDFVEATKRYDWTSFDKKYHQMDILLIDDVQYLEGKTESINQLFNIFNEMTSRNKQIVLSADRTPRDIDMDERYRSRFMSGLLADIKPPDYETRLAIMQRFLERTYQGPGASFTGIIGDDVLDWLASVATSNIREMEGAVTRLVTKMNFEHRSTVTVEEAHEFLEDFFPNQAGKQIDIATIQGVVERYYGVSHEDMVSSKRSKGIAMPRHVAIYLSRMLTEESLESIGKKFGGRDHTTIMHSVSKIDRERKDNPGLFDQIDQLTIRVKEN